MKSIIISPLRGLDLDVLMLFCEEWSEPLPLPPKRCHRHARAGCQPYDGNAVISPGPPQRPVTLYAIFAGDAAGVVILALFEARAPHGVSL